MNLVALHDGLALLKGGALSVLNLPVSRIDQLLQVPDWPDAVGRATVVREAALEDAYVCPPLSQSIAYWLVGSNYHSKLEVTGKATPTEPYFALKAPSAIAGPRDHLTLPSVSSEVDFEGEIAVVMGRIAYNVQARDAWDYIAFVTGTNDVSARDLLGGGRSPNPAKSFPGFGPLGASVATPDVMRETGRMRLRTVLNGEERQRASTDDMVFKIPELVERLTRYTLLRPGDVLATGSPAGSGQEDGRFLRSGDAVEVYIEGVEAPLLTQVAKGPPRRRRKQGSS